jgi:hypothetical protein
MFKDKGLRKALGYKRQKVTGGFGNDIMRDFTIFIVHKILLGS